MGFIYNMKIRDYINATRPHLAIFFIEVVVGALIGINFNLKYLNLSKLLIIFVSFQLFYYGVYIINDIIDYKYDKLSPRKQHRPIASGKIKRKNAFIFSCVLLLIAFLISLKTYKILAGFEIVLLIYIILYSFFLKKIPYVDTLSGAVTHTTRVIMGISLFGIFNHYYLTIFLLLIFSAYLLIKRMKEVNYSENVKHPIKYYSSRKIKIFWFLIVPISLILIILSSGIERIIMIILLIIYILTILAYLKSNKIKNLFEKIAD
jgi:4-hydroxybenzoate polyprenyltransferase